MKRSQELVRDAVSRYVSGESGTPIAKELGIGRSTLMKWVREAGHPVRTQADTIRKPLDEKAFDVISEQSAYWIGFLMADGNITETEKSSPMLIVNLQDSDRGHLEKLASFLKSGCAIQRTRKTSGDKEYLGWRFSVRSKELARSLAVHGVVPRKTITAKTSIEMASNRHFWRGVIDGDGSIYAQRTGSILSLIGSFELISQFCAFCASKGIKRKLAPYQDGEFNAWRVKLHGPDAEYMMSVLYDGSSEYLDRKFKRVQELSSH